MNGVNVASDFDRTADFVLYQGDCLDLLPKIPDGFVKLVVTSPPYNLGKPYESRLDLDEYLARQRQVIEECVRTLNDTGSICWQVGNYVDNGEIIPLDVVLYPIFASLGLHLRNRIVWHFGHGLHASKRFSGRYEVILWFTKSDEYTFNLDAVRVPQKYPGKKHFKGLKRENCASVQCRGQFMTPVRLRRMFHHRLCNFNLDPPRYSPGCLNGQQNSPLRGLQNEDRV